MESALRKGDWVVYEIGSRREIGRVWRVGDRVAFVCYHFGCTAAATPIELLRPYDRDADDDLVPDARIGFHRFDDECPVYEPQVCGGCKEEKNDRD